MSTELRRIQGWLIMTKLLFEWILALYENVLVNPLVKSIVELKWTYPMPLEMYAAPPQTL